MIYFYLVGVFATLSLITSFFTNKWLQIVSRVSTYLSFAGVLYLIYLVADFASQVANAVSMLMWSV
jgi:uncharacterized membrane protein